MQQLRVWFGLLSCCLVTFLAACNKPEATSTEPPTPPAEPVTVPAKPKPPEVSLPADLPIVEGTLQSKKQQVASIFAKIATPLAKPEVIAFYQQQLAEQGWTGIRTTEAPHGTTILASKPNEKRFCNVVVGPPADGTLTVDLTIGTP